MRRLFFVLHAPVFVLEALMISAQDREQQLGEFYRY